MGSGGGNALIKSKPNTTERAVFRGACSCLAGKALSKDEIFILALIIELVFLHLIHSS